MRPSAFVWLQHLLPQRLLGRFVYRISRTRRRWIKAPLIAWFARRYDVDLSAAAEPSLASYPSFNAFFTRALRPGARTIDAAPAAVVCPVDGTLTEYGRVVAGRALQAKGFDYALSDLIGEPAEAFSAGDYATVYLAPRDYHRIHVPLAGTLIRLRYLAGRRFSVNAATAMRIRNLFCRNERLVCWFDSVVGPYALVLVGAFNVSSFSTERQGEIPSGDDRHWTELAPRRYTAGEMFAAFNLGSTVVLLFPRGVVEWDPSLEAGRHLLLGTRIATHTAG
jgi:phosphatidylserine decarboxylase